MNASGKIRAAGYARVSTEQDLQEGSYEFQMQYFRDMINGDPSLELVDVYGDKGKSGRDMTKRPEFLRMIQDCEDGKIDTIYTKSVSRFSRNVSDFVSTLTKLRQLGVNVIFEEQGLDTADTTGELVVNILGIVAEEESKSIGENLRIGLQMRCATGHPIGKVPYGYRRIDKDANWAIEEEEARRIRLAFRMAAAGNCYPEIRKALNEMEREAGTGVVWNRERLRRTLRSIVYKGDVLTGKSYVVHGRKKAVRINRGERPQYLLQEHHAPIVTLELFDRVQSLIELGLLNSLRKTIPDAHKRFLADESWRGEQDRLEAATVYTAPEARYTSKKGAKANG